MTDTAFRTLEQVSRQLVIDQLSVHEDFAGKSGPLVGPAMIRQYGKLEYKMQPLMRDGGMVFSLDHRIPNGTPLENHRYYVDTGREILGLPPRDPTRRGWRRMAF